MILGDTLNQPLALAIFAILGTVFGIVYSANNFICGFVFKNPFYRHITQVIYVILYATIFFALSYKYFDYALKIYQLAICLFFTVTTSILLFLPIKKYRRKITVSCDKLINKIAQSKLVQRFKK